MHGLGPIHCRLMPKTWADRSRKKNCQTKTQLRKQEGSRRVCDVPKSIAENASIKAYLYLAHALCYQQAVKDRKHVAMGHPQTSRPCPATAPWLFGKAPGRRGRIQLHWRRRLRPRTACLSRSPPPVRLPPFEAGTSPPAASAPRLPSGLRASPRAIRWHRG